MAREPLVDECFVLHRYAWKESSFVLRVLSHRHGYMGLVARGLRAGRRQAPLAIGVCCDLDFRPGRELGQVIELRPREPMWSPAGEAWWALQYLNELLLHCLTEQDPCPALYELYARTLQAIRPQGTPVAPVIRQFEYGLLQSLGLGFDAASDEQGEPLIAGERYALVPEEGLRQARGGEGCSGADWLALVRGELGDAAAARLRQPLQDQLALQVDFSRLKSRTHWQQARRLAQQHQQHASAENPGAH